MTRSLPRLGALAALVLALVAGCATPAIDAGAYSETPMRSDILRIRFAGNALMTRDMVQRYFLYRCAEATLARGYTYMELRAATRGMFPVASADPSVTREREEVVEIWANDSYVRMFNQWNQLREPVMAWDARQVKRELAGFVATDGASFAALPSPVVIDPSQGVMSLTEATSRLRGDRAPTMDDLKNLLPSAP